MKLKAWPVKHSVGIMINKALKIYLFRTHKSLYMYILYYKHVEGVTVVYQLIKIYGSKRPGYRLLMKSSGCATLNNCPLINPYAAMSLYL